MMFRPKASPSRFQEGGSTMEELTFLARKVRADHVLAHALKAMGWTTTKLGALWGCDQEVVDSVILRVEEKYPEYKVNTVEFENLVQAAEEASCIIWARHEELKDSDLALASRLAKQEGKLADRRKAREEQIGSQVRRKGEAARVKWPTRATMLKSAAGSDLYQRNLVEDAERNRWLKELAKQIKEADTCDVSDANQGLFAARIGKGRRATSRPGASSSGGCWLRMGSSGQRGPFSLRITLSPGLWNHVGARSQ